MSKEHNRNDGMIFRKADEGILERSRALRLRGVLAVCVMLYHLILVTPALSEYMPSWIVIGMGYFPVACFFFLSGYGLMTQYQRKGAQYIAEFPRKRLLPFYLTICVITGLYSILTLATGNEAITIRLLIQSLTFGGDTIISKGWYLQVALLCYLVFYCTMRCIRSNRARFFAGAGALIAYFAMCKAMKCPEYYYLTVPCFLLGCIWDFLCGIACPLSNFQELLLSILLFGAVWIGCVALGYPTLLIMAASLLFVVMLVRLLNAARIPPIPLLDCLGRVSFEIYIIHGFFMILYNEGLRIDNAYFYVVAVVLSSLAGAAILRPLFSKIYAICRTETRIKQSG